MNMPMESTPTSHHRVAAVVATLVGFALIATGGYALREDLLARAQQQQQHTATALEALAMRIDRLDAAMHNLAEVKPDPAPLLPMQQQLGEVDAHTTALTARIEALEHQLASLPAPAPAPIVTAAPTPPTPAAAVNPGTPHVTTHAEHMAEFHRIVDSLPPSAPADSAALAQINQHLAGLVSTHKTVDEPYAPLRRAQDITAARAAIAALPAADRAPFAAWLATLDAADTGAY